MADDDNKEQQAAEPEKREATRADDGVQPASMPVDPDLEFVKTITEWGGGELKACFQCATCSVVCPLSPETNPFPRKEIIWAQWGFKDRLVNDPDLWLCHRCNDCSENCPRGAKTGDVLAALRSYAYQEHAWPGFLGKLLNRPLLAPVALAIPFLLVWALIALKGSFAAPLGNSPELASRYWGNMINPWPWLDLTFLAAAGFAVLCLGMSISRAWRGFMESGVQPDVTPKMSKLQALWHAVMDILPHNRFKQCGAAHARRSSHLLILFGFGGLFLTTVLVFIGMYFGFGLQTPLPLDHPIKILGNASTLAIGIGLILTIIRRTNPAELINTGRNSYQDVLFLGVLTLTVLTGLLAQVFRLATFHQGAAVVYYAHLSFIMFLFLWAPFSKFAHVVYHTTALTWAHHVGRKLGDLSASEIMPHAASAPAEKKDAA